MSAPVTTRPGHRSATREALVTLAVAIFAVLLLLVVVEVDPPSCFRDDMLAQYLGASREVWLAARQGHLALLTPRSWFGGAIAGEYQHGVFSVFAVATHVLAWSLGGSLRSTALALVAVPVATLMAGSFRLARVEGCSIAAAVFAATLSTFNAWTLRWAIPWYPSLATFAWVPWLLWALRRGGRSRPFLVIVTTYAILAGGWPFTNVIAVVAGGVVFTGELLRKRDPRSLLALVPAVMLGACIAAPALLMLTSFGAAGERLSEKASYTGQWTISLRALPGLVSTAWSSTWEGFGVAVERRAPELWLGIPLVFIVSMLGATGTRKAMKKAAPWLVMAAIALVLGAVRTPPPFRWPFRWLPLVHLAVGVAAAIALDVWRGAITATRSRLRLAWAPGALLVLIGLLGALLATLHPLPAALFDAPSAILLLLGLLGIAALPSRALALSGWWPSVAAVVGVLVLLGTTPATEVTTWFAEEALLDPAPFDPARTYLGLYYAPRNGLVDLRFGNLPLLAGLTFVNGYSPLGPEVVAATFPFETHGWLLNARGLQLFVRIAASPDLLDDLGIDGLVMSFEVEGGLAPALARGGWSPVATLVSGRVWHRSGVPSPRAWLVDAAEDDDGRHARLAQPLLRIVESDVAMRVTLDTAVDRPALLVFKRAAYPGYEATVDGVPVRTELYRNALAAVPIAAGTRGTVSLRYHPRSLLYGSAIAGLALVISASWLAFAFRRGFARTA